MIDAIVPTPTRPSGPMPPEQEAFTLFLDRDGVINVRPRGPGPEGYVKSWGEFSFLPGVLDALASVRDRRVVVVTNQRGVSRGFMTLDDVRAVHERMIAEVADAGGRIDAVYCCPDGGGPDRKPEPGMLLRAMADDPGIDPSRSVIVGDSATDLLAGRAAGVGGVLVGDEPSRRGEAAKLDAAGIAAFAQSPDLPGALASLRG